MSGDPTEEGYLSGLADVAFKLVGLDADVLLLLAGGAIQAVVFYLGARLFGLLTSPARRSDLIEIAMFVFPAVVLGVLPGLILDAGLSDLGVPGSIATPVGVATMVYAILVAPAITLGVWGWKEPGLLGRWFAAAAPVPVVLAVAFTTLITQGKLEESFRWSDMGSVWLAPDGEVGHNGVSWWVPLAGWHERPDPIELCDPIVVLPDGTDYRARFQPRTWLPPELSVEFMVVVVIDDHHVTPEGSTLCCLHRREICFEGFIWPPN